MFFYTFTLCKIPAGHKQWVIAPKGYGAQPRRNFICYLFNSCLRYISLGYSRI